MMLHIPHLKTIMLRTTTHQFEDLLEVSYNTPHFAAAHKYSFDFIILSEL